MAGGLIALLDDVAALAKIAAASLDDVAAGAAKAGSKTLGVIIDDTAVTPQYVKGLSPKRELPIIWRITRGSIRNKIFFILPAVLLLSIFAPWSLPYLLIVGGSYLCFEGAHKIVERLAGHSPQTPAIVTQSEDSIVRQAVRTDFILSSEIMVIALNEVSDSSIWQQAMILIFVAFLITIFVYGVVALIVKADDVGLALSLKNQRLLQITGKFLLKAMPWVLRLLTVVGTLAMLWVGGHMLIIQLDEIGFAGPHHLLSSLVDPVVSSAGSVIGWSIETLSSATVGFGWGLILVGIFLAYGKLHKNYAERDGS
ncbi:DUF808 domain-containing protein [Arcanobacterium pinnipediorum]|uniref:DUF808 domain-containing protein n=1 Tax=Arcanobacterium pinnipediorum TaxID=1503041 RepID=A0ABY5AFH9_9ACTO|nr:DUF808 domain-containing protein [Arcanobacterium pinnipediorum]USR78962.1 DUF808 domain-containing protein [Arcanobacterium pinnipediorum]